MLTKSLSFLSVYLFGLIINAQTAQSSIDEALLIAKEEQKHVFVIVKASWCGYCHKMNEQLKDPKISEAFNRNFVFVEWTAYEKGNQKVNETPGAYEYLRDIRLIDKGLPTWFILTPDGDLRKTSMLTDEINLGCPMTKYEIIAFKDILEKTTDFTKEEFNKLQEVFSN